MTAGAPEVITPRVDHTGGSLTDTAARKRGRPSLYTPELADLICRRLSEAESLRAICREAGMPSPRTVLGWLDRRPEFRRQYDLARKIATLAVAHEILEIADNVHRRNSPDALKDARREIDALKWHLGRMAPKRRD